MVNTMPVVRPRRRLGSLDGLRALAVVAVFIYHLNDRWLPGGFLGVDVFFVLSGYLVTSLLVSEHHRHHGIALREFWKRRARRLWAAAWVVLAVVALAGLWNMWGADRQATLPGEIFASVAHIANYWELAHGGYLQQFAAPSPVRHFWSLAVEEQFYFVWPLVMLGGLALAVRFGRRAMWALLILLGAASMTVGLFVSAERAYLGTATRAIALIVGALLAWAWSDSPLAAPTRPLVHRVVMIWAVLGAAVLIAGMALLHPYDEVMARGGFFTIAVASAGVIGLAVSRGRTATALSWAPLVWIGRRSYGIYLIHWPLIVAMGPGRPPWLVAAVVIPVTVLAAAALHQFIETPLIERRWRPVVLGRASIALLVVVVFSLYIARPTSTPTGDVASGLGQVADPTGSGHGAGSASSTTTTICVPKVSNGNLTTDTGVDGSFDPNTVTDLTDPDAQECADQIDVMVVGDSTGRGFSNGLAALGDAGLRIWDRTILGCSLGSEDCGDWRDEWSAPVRQIDPDVVVMYFNPVTDLKGVDDADFLSAKGAEQRKAALTEAADLLSSRGAALVFVAPPVPRAPNGLFFCGGRRTDTQCDPRYVKAWTDTINEVAAAHKAPVMDVEGFLNEIGDNDSTRPDGMHFTAPALKELALWARPIINLAVMARTGAP